MHLETAERCRAYVESELDRSVRRREGWVASAALEAEWSHSGGPRPRSSDILAWRITPGPGTLDWYRLEAVLHDQEFLVWFGNHQVGAGGIHWIMRPAVHIAFQDLAPIDVPIGMHFGLGDVLETMINSLDIPSPLVTVFALNSLSLT